MQRGKAIGVNVGRAANVRRGIRIEVFKVIWMVIESVVPIGAGLLAGSVLLTAFGLDSVIELVSGAMLLWRLVEEAREGDTERVERAEHLATWLVAILLTILCLYMFIGILISLTAVIVMPWLGFTKRHIARQIDSGALRGDAATVLVGLVLNALFHWWWAEYVAAFVFLLWLVRETLEAFEEAREGKKADEG